jgi:DNA modification methylase
MGDERADMMFTDPPYGVNYEGGIQFSSKGVVRNNRKALVNDSDTAIYGDFLQIVADFIDGPCYMWFAGTRGADVYAAVVDAGYQIHALIIWHKVNATYAAMNAQYKQRHEPCLYFKPKSATLRWCGPSDECTLWEIKRDAINDKHPTQKPVELAARAIGNHDATTVLDLFAGSGSTVAAAEQLGRQCYGMEISPAYCAVTIQRLVDMGCEPCLESD